MKRSDNFVVVQRRHLADCSHLAEVEGKAAAPFCFVSSLNQFQEISIIKDKATYLTAIELGNFVSFDLDFPELRFQQPESRSSSMVKSQNGSPLALSPNCALLFA